MDATQAPSPGTLAPLSGTEAVLVGLAALAVVAIPFLWPLVEQFNVMAHEGAHALVGFAMGFKSDGVTMDSKTAAKPAISRPVSACGPR